MDLHDSNTSDAAERAQECMELYDSSLQLHRFSEALEHVNRALQLIPDNAQYWFKRSQMLIFMKRYDEALESYDRALAIDPEFIKVWFHRGLALAVLERMEDAIQSFDQAIALSPDYVKAHYRKGTVLQKMEKSETALECYERVLTLDDEHIGATSGKAHVLSTMGRKEEAFEWYRRLTRLEPDSALNWYNRGMAEQYLGHHADALASYNRALSYDPKHALSWNNKGTILLEQERFQEALHFFEQAIKYGHVAAANGLASSKAKIRSSTNSTARQGASEYELGDVIVNNFVVYSVARGGMGVVYLCYDNMSKEPVAIKTFQDKYLSSVASGRQFLKEGLIWVQLKKHPHIVQCRGAFEVDGRPYVLLEYVAGIANIGLSLRQWIMKGRLDAAIALEFAIQFCAAMRYAQETLPGFVHRDIKPENILVNSERMVKVTDFGLALSIASPAAGGLRLGGTLPYMPPEQFTYERLDVRSDIYAFGCVLYEMFTGRPVFSSTSAEGYHKCHLEAEPVPPQTLVPSIPDELNNLILSCLQKPLDRRPTNFEEVANVLTRVYERLTGQQPAQIIMSDDSEGEITSRALSLHNLKRTEEALELLDKVMSTVSPSDVLWFIRGNMLLAISRFEEALDAYDRFLSVDSDEAIAGWINRGCCLDRLGRSEEALESFDRALALNPKSYEAWLSKADTLAKLERFAEAEQYLDGYLKIDPRDRDFLYVKGDLLSRQGLYAEAIEYFDRALSVDPMYWRAWNSKGIAFSALKNWGMAQLCFERLTHIDEGDAGAWYKNGMALLELREFKEAARCFDKVLTLSPEHQGAREQKALALQGLNDPSKGNTEA